MMGNLLSTVYDDCCMYLQNCYRLLELGKKIRFGSAKFLSRFSERHNVSTVCANHDTGRVVVAAS